jgi:hypothetical protein
VEIYEIGYNERMIENLDFFNYLSAIGENGIDERSVEEIWEEMQFDPTHKYWTVPIEMR